MTGGGGDWKGRVDWKGLSDFNRRRGQELIDRARQYWQGEIARGRRPDEFHVRRLLREAAEKLGIAEVHLQEAINNPPGQVIDEHQSSKGHSMASLEEVKAGIGQSNDTASNSLGALQQAASNVEEAQGLLMKSVEGSSQNDQQEALALYAKALESINEAQQGVQAATQSAEGVAARL